MTELQTLTGWSRHEIREFAQRGMPALEVPKGRGGNWAFDLAEVIRWRLSALEGGEVLDFEAARNRKMSAEAKIAELEFGERAGRMADVALIERMLAAAIVPAKACLQSLSGELEALVDETQHALIRDRITEALEALQNTADELPDDEGSSEAA